MTTRFWFVRHGPTHATGLVGWTDMPADLGDLAALQRLSDALPGEAVVVSSDLIRARATADAIAADRTRLSHDPSLREMHFGSWEGLDHRDIPEDEQTLSRQFWENPGDVSPPEGESWNDFAGRVNHGVLSLATRYAGRDIVVVAHFGVIVAALAQALQMPPKGAFSLQIDNLSLTRIDHFPKYDSWRVTGVNHKP